MLSKFLLAASLVAAPMAIAAPAAAVQPGDEAHAWRDVATEQDRARIRAWRSTWLEALRAARGRHAADIAREGPLVDPDGALLTPQPPAGEYLCRTIKIGAQQGTMFEWLAYPQYRCMIGRDGDRMTFRRIGGSQRPVGHIYPDSVRRMIFLGSLQLGDERQVLSYGTDMRRDMAGILERVGEARWRLVFPRPTFESLLDVIELVPAR
jgi:hypothetical protein